MLVFVVTKNVREELRISCAWALRPGLDIVQGLKPASFLGAYGTTQVVP
jgi:hypothetical protein